MCIAAIRICTVSPICFLVSFEYCYVFCRLQAWSGARPVETSGESLSSGVKRLIKMHRRKNRVGMPSKTLRIVPHRAGSCCVIAHYTIWAQENRREWRGFNCIRKSKDAAMLVCYHNDANAGLRVFKHLSRWIMRIALDQTVGQPVIVVNSGSV